MELIEISFAEFKAAAPGDGADLQQFITEAASKLGLHLRYREWPSSVAPIARLYITHANRIADDFFAAFRIEYRGFFPERVWNEKTDKESRIDNVLRNIGLDLKTRVVYAVFNYYLDVRHATVHSPRKRQLGQLGAAHAQLISKHQDELRTLYGRLPNRYDGIGYYDFVVFTRAIREIAKLVSEHSRPSEASMFEAVNGPGVERHFVGRPARAHTAVSHKLQQCFGLLRPDADRIAREHLGQ